MFLGKQPQLLYAGKTYITSLITFISIAMNVLLNIPFIMAWGALGAAWATLFAGLISGGIQFAFSQYYYPIKWEYGKILSIYSIFFAAAMAVIVMRSYSVDYAVRVAAKVCFLFLYLWLGVRIRILTMENWQLLKGMLLRHKRIPAASVQK